MASPVGSVPGEGFETFGKSASYSPGDGKTTPYKPVMLAYRQNDSTLVTPNNQPVPPSDPANPPKFNRLSTRKRGVRSWCTKRKVIIASVVAAVILLLVLVLPIALTLGRSPAIAPIRRTTQKTTKTPTTATPLKLSPTPSSWLHPPPPVANCSGFSFRCLNQREEVRAPKVCDGKPDCSDTSDEDHCEECRTALFCESETGHKLCLRGKFLCDGKEDCPNGIDEKEYCNRKCLDVEYTCQGGDVCIPETWRCDGDAHCPNEDDEVGCTQTMCQNGTIWCGRDRTCLSAAQMCDGVAHCSDGSDEAMCNCQECSGSDLVLCRHPGGRCIRKSQLCDGKPDCPDAEDETNCPGSCEMTGDDKMGKVKCENGRELSARWACSGLYPECQSRCATCDTELAFSCSSSRKCIPRRQMCDGRVDCEDGSDEAECDCDGEDVFRCAPSPLHPTTKCIPVSKRCDGYHDCPTGEDEKDCDECDNELGEERRPFLCKPTRTCHPSSARCDGQVDCVDYSDEDHCPCHECKNQPYATFLCKANSRCLKESYVCEADSPFHCPGAAPEDLQLCQPDYDPLHPKP